MILVEWQQEVHKMTAEITFEKGNYLMTVFSDTVAENLTNKLFYITPPQSKGNQGSGKKETKVVDLLRITHQFVIKGYICGSATTDTYPAKLSGAAQDLTAKQVKDYLKNIAEGGETAGGTVTMTYDGDTYNGYIEKLNFVEKAIDSIETSIKDAVWYEVSVTFVKGVST
jgi:hypothetical protein